MPEMSGLWGISLVLGDNVCFCMGIAERPRNVSGTLSYMKIMSPLSSSHFPGTFDCSNDRAICMPGG